MTSRTTDRAQPEQDHSLAGEHVLAHLRVLGREMGALSRAVSRSLGLHHTQLRALEQLMRRIDLSPGDLSRALGLSTGSTTALIDALERMGHVHRVRDPGDRRKVVLEITERARHDGEAAFRPLGERFRELTQGYSEAELVIIDRFLADLRGALREYQQVVSEEARATLPDSSNSHLTEQSTSDWYAEGMNRQRS
jgi:DNA-binding MarR family transcriptional regulator